ncbi:BAX inhibitor (BI)-1/YccA family protein [Candidatus Dojkabacteria bacterium]|nr:BAX inhibitor (BI)-1/YccA family protein [Candidatus Dojkabacteria bacterium]
MQTSSSIETGINSNLIELSSFSTLLSKVYAWLGVGIFITMITALTLYYTGIAQLLYQTPLAMPVLLILQIGLVIILSIFSTRLNSVFSIFLFLFYSFSMGITMTAIFYAFSITSVLITFFVASTMFGVMAAYGFFTKNDLTHIGNIALMGLLGLIMASVLNIFFANHTIDWLLTYVGIAIFLILIASDTQKIKKMSMLSETIKGNLAIVGALTLYLDFVNIFLRLLKLLGNRRR